MTYYEDPGPGYGVLPARAAVRTDAGRLSLNGQWRFRLAETVADDGFEKVDFDDSEWAYLPVPSSWPMHGHGRPAYTNQKYPFPVTRPTTRASWTPRWTGCGGWSSATRTTRAW